MSPQSLGRLAVGLVLALGVAFGSVAPASADDASLKQTIKQLDKRLEKRSAAISFPDDASSPTYGADYAAGVAKLDTLLDAYRKGVSAERGSTSKGRRARTLMLRAVASLRSSLKTVAGVLRDAKPGEEATEEEQGKLETAVEKLKSAEKDNARAYRLLGMKPPKSVAPGEPGTTKV